jgi:hypothetical protein
MTHLYCTLFDKGFMNRGLALHESLMRYAPKPFRLFILCMDNIAYGILEKMALPNVTLIALDEFERKEPEISAAKSNRNLDEYCWTLGSGLTNHIMENYTDKSGNASELVIYVDADLYYFSSLQPIFDLFGDHSTLIIPHNHPEKRKQKEESVGKYNVGMLIFRNNADGRACLKWWRDKCVEWCYNRVEPERFGDQKYLDYFEERFKGVYVLTHKGCNLAPWCICNFKGMIRKRNGRIMIDDVPLIFFHFSSFKIYFPYSRFRPSIVMNNNQYGKPSKTKSLIYDPYAHALYASMEKIRKIQPDFTAGTVSRTSYAKESREVVLPLFWWQFKDIVRPYLNPVFTFIKGK